MSDGLTTDCFAFLQAFENLRWLNIELLVSAVNEGYR